jgi:hypothetical protein
MKKSKRLLWSEGEEAEAEREGEEERLARLATRQGTVRLFGVLRSTPGIGSCWVVGSDWFWVGLLTVWNAALTVGPLCSVGKPVWICRGFFWGRAWMPGQGLAFLKRPHWASEGLV